MRFLDFLVRKIQKAAPDNIPPYITPELREYYLRAEILFESRKDASGKLGDHILTGDNGRIIPKGEERELAILHIAAATVEDSGTQKHFRQLANNYVIAQAETGNALYQTELGRMYWAGQVSGKMGKPDSVTAKMWFEKAAAQNDPLALSFLGDMCQYASKAGPRDLLKAKHYYERAIEYGYDTAKQSLEIIEKELKNSSKT